MKKIEKLSVFSPALIYGLSPKASPHSLLGSDSFRDTLFHSVDQYNDLLEGYLYAESDILPKFKQRDKEKIHPEQLLGWIIELHRKISKSLLAVWGRESGIYCDEAILRWNHGSLICDGLIRYFSGQHECKTDKKMANYLADKFKVDEENSILFLKLMDKINKAEDIPIFRFQAVSILEEKKGLKNGIQALHKLYAAIALNRLSLEDKKLTEQFVEACLIPLEIPKAMQEYADRTSQQFYACDPSDLDQVSAFLSNSFYEFIKIHAFTKGNGRVAICLMNIYLHGFGLPPILLSQLDKEGKEDSAYLKAIESISTTRTPLRELIKSKIIAAQKEPLMDKSFERLISLRIEFVELCRRILTKYPTFDIDKLKMECYLSSGFKLIFMQQANPNETAILAVQFLIKIFSENEITMDLATNSSRLFSLKDKFSQAQADTLRLHMEKISGQTGWKINKAQGKIWLELSDETLANDVFQRIKSFEIGEVNLKRILGREHVLVVLCEKINLMKLASTSLERVTAIQTSNPCV